MQFNTSVTYPTDPTTVKRMLSDEQFHRLRAQVAQARVISIQIEADPQADIRVSSTFEVDLKSLNVPASLSRWLPSDHLQFTVVETCDHSGTGRLEASVSRIPAFVQATTELRGEDGHTVREIKGTLTVKVPLLGGKLEQTALAHLEQVIAADTQAAGHYLNT